MSGRKRDSWRRLYLEPSHLTHVEWLACAKTHPDQNAVWRDYERFGREAEAVRRAHPETYDMGGES